MIDSYDAILALEAEKIQQANLAKREKESEQAKLDIEINQAKALADSKIKFPIANPIKEEVYYLSGIELFCSQKLDNLVKYIDNIRDLTHHQNLKLREIAYKMMNIKQSLKATSYVDIIIESAITDNSGHWVQDTRGRKWIPANIIKEAKTLRVDRTTFYKYARQELLKGL